MRRLPADEPPPHSAVIFASRSSPPRRAYGDFAIAGDPRLIRLAIGA